MSEMLYDEDAKKVYLPEVVALHRGGKVVASVSATYDLGDVPAEHLDHILHILTHRTVILMGLPTEESMTRSERFDVAMRRYEALPLWKRLITLGPSY